ncbi:MAG TPA: ANTAR domain-containing protein [Clostridiales bacterium]|nr:ANTAR domain-containing protein [Clostridiales bacterium]
MALAEPHCSVLVVSSSEQGAEFIIRLLDPSKYEPVTVLKNAGEARRRFIGSSFDIVIINTPLSDEFGHELAMNLAEDSYGTILIVKNQIFDEISNKMERFGVLTLSKPLSAGMFQQTLSLLNSVRERVKRIEKENIELRLKIDELRIVGKAKCLLIEKHGMSEPEAHRYIEKQAMDMRITKYRVAEEILQTNED